MVALLHASNDHCGFATFLKCELCLADTFSSARESVLTKPRAIYVFVISCVYNFISMSVVGCFPFATESPDSLCFSVLIECSSSAW